MRTFLLTKAQWLVKQVFLYGQITDNKSPLLPKIIDYCWTAIGSGGI